MRPPIPWVHDGCPACTRTPRVGVAAADRRRGAGGLYRRGNRSALAGGRVDRHRFARSGSGNHAGAAVHPGGGGDRRGAGRRVVSFRGVPGAAAKQRSPRRRRIPRASRRDGGVGGLGGVCRPAGPADHLRRVRSPGGRPPQPGHALVAGRTDQHRLGVALDRDPGRGGHAGEFVGAALVMDAAAARRVAGDADSARADRSLVGRRFARPGHQQPADPPRRRQPVGRRPARPARPRTARRRPHRPGGTAFLDDRTVVLGRDGAQRIGQRRGARPAVRPAHHRLRAAGRRQVRRAVRAGRPRLAPAARRSGCAASRSESASRAQSADPAGADRGRGLRPHLRHRRRAGPHRAAAAAGPAARRFPKPRSATTSTARPPWRASCSTGAST